jgi:hypothetical protein
MELVGGMGNCIVLIAQTQNPISPHFPSSTLKKANEYREKKKKKTK